MYRSSMTIRYLLILAAATWSLPSAALPCTCVGQDSAESSDKQPHDHLGPACSGCCGAADSSKQPAVPSHAPDPCEDSPCDCAPGCPSACCASKLPCPPIDPVAQTAALHPFGVRLDLATDIPADVHTGGIFHPPRV